MLNTSEQVKDALLDAVVQLAKDRYRRASPDQVERLIRLYYQRVAPQDLEDKDPIDLYGAAVRHWQLADQRAPTETLVRVYNPDVNEDGWGGTHTVIDVVNDDMPFIVDSVLAMLELEGRRVHVLVHPMAHVERDETGKLLAIEAAEIGDTTKVESFLHIEVDRVADPKQLAEMSREVTAVIHDVRAAVDDWMEMRSRATELAAELDTWAAEPSPRYEFTVGSEPTEVAALLRWMEQGAFIFVGYREYDFLDDDKGPRIQSLPETGLGTLRQTEVSMQSLDQLPKETTDQARRPLVLNLTKANSLSTVHRAVPLDYVGIKRIDESGKVVGERRFLGLFTSIVYTDRVQDIPVVRAKATEVIERSDFHPGSHDRNRLLNVLQRYPRDELFQMDVDRLEALTLEILDLRDRRQVSLLVRQDDYGRFLSCMVFVPRDRHSTDVRLEIQEILMEAYQGKWCRFSTEISDDPLARLHLVIYTDPTAPADLPSTSAVQSRLSRVIRTWDDYLRKSLVETHGEDKGLVLLSRYGSSFSTSYRSAVLAETAVSDMDFLEGLDDGGLDVTLHRPLEAGISDLRCKLYRANDPITLSAFIPLLHDLGVEVIDEIPHEVSVMGERRRFIYDIGVRLNQELDQQGRARFRDALLAVWNGEAESDDFAQLVTTAGLTWREVSVLRAYARYLVQLGTHFSPAYVRETVNQNPQVARLLIDLFGKRFDPANANREDALKLAADIHQAIDSVASLDADRILRSFVALIEATVRTNYWQEDDEGKRRPALAFKLDPSSIPDVPKPVPAAEIFVYCPRTEGVHLRSGRVARGGLRWSERMEDFRTEILGLMKAQTVKNSVIVPVGAKGGFVARQLPAGGDRDAVMAEVVHCYKTFIGALLDVTDNMVDGVVVPPQNTVRHDDDDPYLVVAADKGTATFSDTANEIAEARGFWLGDAFASGGSAGYDHKALAITARGAWVSVERHFREMGTPVSQHEFTAVGIGDMSGDVFGNGMLRSPNTLLIAAFDHRHVFVDPAPDAASSFAERARLYKLPRSSWDDYDRSKMSAGGGVFPRSAKSIDITDEIAAALDIEGGAGTCTPTELMKAILRAPVKLLWNGGIGTYVKASTETDQDVGDRNNDALRVDATELRCSVLAEGGNLGVTQHGRIEFARLGGRVNTDAIDNSAGVDCSDHEVNLKILLAQAVRDGDLTLKHRDLLLESMSDETCALVLANNEAQNRAISLAVAQAPGMVEVHQRLMHWLEERMSLDRGLEFLPSDAELEQRKGRGEGLTRPELAVLLAYTKNLVTEDLVASDLPQDPAFNDHLVQYFPSTLAEEHGDLILNHPLRDELVATVVSNRLVNQAGITMVHRLIGETSADISDIARAYHAASQIYDLDTARAEVQALDGSVSADVQTELELEIKRLCERATRWLLRNEVQPLDIAHVVDKYAAAVQALHTLALVDETGDTYQGVPADLACRVEALGSAFGFLELSRVAATNTTVKLESVAAISRLLDDELGLDWLRNSIIALPRDDHWETMARGSLRDEYVREHAELAEAVLNLPGGEPNETPEQSVKRWLRANAVMVERLQHTFADIAETDQQNLARMSVAVRALRQFGRGA